MGKIVAVFCASLVFLAMGPTWAGGAETPAAPATVVSATKAEAAVPAPPVAAADPSKSKKMVIFLDTESGGIRVTDGQQDLKPVTHNEARIGRIVDVQTITVIRTHSSPGCVWVCINGIWYWICN
jgi:hypothetical protein